MKKVNKALLALTAVIAISVAGLVHAGGYPRSLVLNSGVAYTIGGGAGVSGTSSTVTNTPAVLCSNPSSCGWLESIRFDSMVGPTATVVVSLYDVPGLSTLAGMGSSGGPNLAYLSVSPSAFLIDQFTLISTTANTGVGGPQMYSLTQPIKLDYYISGNLVIADTTNNPDTVTASILLGKPADSRISVYSK